MSALQSFKRCPKSFYYKEVLHREGPTSERVQEGSEFHEILEYAARYVKGLVTFDELKAHCAGRDMFPVAQEYLQHHPLPTAEDILLIEDPIYTMLLPEDVEHSLPAVFVRTTYDKVWRDENGWIVGDDYKTFSKMPSGDALMGDLDFQARLYMKTLQLLFNTLDVKFRWRYVRNEVARELKGQGLVAWPIDERYVDVEIVAAQHELNEIWLETQAIAWRIRHLLVAQRLDAELANFPMESLFYRVDLKGSSPHTCGQCFVRDLCKAHLAQGELDDQTIDIVSLPRNEARGMTYAGVATDPRVVWDMAQGRTLAQAVRGVYGDGGTELLPSQAMSAS